MLQHPHRHKQLSVNEPKCPAILKHPIYPSWMMLLIVALESFVIGVIVGAAIS